MSTRIRTYVYAKDALSQAGVSAHLRPQSEVELIEAEQIDLAAVAVVVADEVDGETLRVVRAVQRNGCPKVVLVVARLDDSGVFAALEAGACGFLRRQEASSASLVALIRAADNGDGTVPPDLLGRLLCQVGRLQRQVLSPLGLTPSGLTDREIEVLRLVADGYDTAEIALKLSYSERTIKNVIHDITSRLSLRNRTHAVAWAVREGLL